MLIGRTASGGQASHSPARWVTPAAEAAKSSDTIPHMIKPVGRSLSLSPFVAKALRCAAGLGVVAICAGGALAGGAVHAQVRPLAWYETTTNHSAPVAAVLAHRPYSAVWYETTIVRERPVGVAC